MLIAQSLVEYGTRTATESEFPRLFNSLKEFVGSVSPVGWLAAGLVVLVVLRVVARAR